MHVEHIGLNVPDAAAMAAWYQEHLGMQVVKQLHEACFFIADETGHGILEIYTNPKAPIPEYKSMDPLELHFAFCSEDIEADFRRLVTAGATPVSKPAEASPGSVLAMLRDPWGLVVQLASRTDPMI
jgi:glyoxylase I family protein